MKLYVGLAAALLLTDSAIACIGKGVTGHVKRDPHAPRDDGLRYRRGRQDNHKLVARAQMTEAQVAQANTTEEAKLCNASPPASLYAILPNYPAIGEIADILANDTQALAIMQAINASGVVPSSIQPHGTPPGSYSGNGIQNGYNYNTDADCWWTSTLCDTPKHPGLLDDITTCAEPHTWGYTFDDGPSCTHNALYDFWAANNQKVSLMYIGSNVMSYPLQAQRGLMDGHHLCVHTWSHQYTTSLTSNQVFAELYYTIKAFKEVLGITPTCWRPPYGDVDDRVRGIAQSLGLRTYVWSGDTNDWDIAPDGGSPTATIQANYNSLKSIGTSPAAETGGIIVLDHELDDPDMNLAMQEYPSIKQSWKYVVPLTACLNVTQPYAEDIIYPNFADYIGGTVTPSGLPSVAPSITTVSSITPQGTLSGMSGLMATAEAGGPQGPTVSYTLGYTSSGMSATGTATRASSNGGSSDSTSAAGSPAWFQVPITMITGSFASAIMLLYLL